MFKVQCPKCSKWLKLRAGEKAGFELKYAPKHGWDEVEVAVRIVGTKS